MSMGENIRQLREERKLTQEQVAEALGVSFQAVSSWERDEYRPDTDKLIRLAEVLDVSISSIAEEKKKTFKTKDAIYDWEHMKTYVKTSAKNFKMENALKAVDYAVKRYTIYLSSTEHRLSCIIYGDPGGRDHCSVSSPRCS